MTPHSLPTARRPWRTHGRARPKAAKQIAGSRARRVGRVVGEGGAQPAAPSAQRRRQRQRHLPQRLPPALNSSSRPLGCGIGKPHQRAGAVRRAPPSAPSTTTSTSPSRSRILSRWAWLYLWVHNMPSHTPLLPSLALFLQTPAVRVWALNRGPVPRQELPAGYWPAQAPGPRLFGAGDIAKPGMSALNPPHP